MWTCSNLLAHGQVSRVKKLLYPKRTCNSGPHDQVRFYLRCMIATILDDALVVVIVHPVLVSTQRPSVT